MLKKTMKYVDFNDVEREEDFYFNLTKQEVMEMELSTSGGLAECIDKLIKTQDMPEIVKIFKELILKAYGEKSPDGKRFIKNEAVRDGFAQTNAFSDLYMLLATDSKEAAKFVNSIIPADMTKPTETPATIATFNNQQN